MEIYPAGQAQSDIFITKTKYISSRSRVPPVELFKEFPASLGS
jgi:hypothetical protein